MNTNSVSILAELHLNASPNFVQSVIGPFSNVIVTNWLASWLLDGVLFSFIIHINAYQKNITDLTGEPSFLIHSHIETNSKWLKSSIYMDDN